MRRQASLAASALAAFGGLTCGDVVSQPIGLAAAVDGGGPANPDSSEGSHSGAGTDSGQLILGDAESASFCDGHGPIPLAGKSTCIGDLAQIFRFAACACKSFDISGSLSTDSFDSTSDAGPATGALASIGSNGEISTNSRLSIAGSLWTGGPGPDGGPAVTLSGGASAGGTITQDVHSAADMDVGGKYLVEGNVSANGNVTVDPGGSLAVLGTVYVPAGDSAFGVQGTVVNMPVAGTAPCSCAAPIDVASIVAAYANSNDDSSVGLAPDASLAATATLPCGRYYVAGVEGDTVSLQINGRVALFVGGDISVTHDLRIELAPGAELDLFVSGSVSIMGSVEIGDANSPARTRLYMGGATLALAASASPLAANIYAPNAVLELASDFEMWGSIFADHLQFSGAFAIHYDTSVLKVAQASGCAPPAGSCQTCNDCAGSTPACKAGTCAPCTTTADCCAPLDCNSSGACELTIR